MYNCTVKTTNSLLLLVGELFPRFSASTQFKVVLITPRFCISSIDMRVTGEIAEYLKIVFYTSGHNKSTLNPSNIAMNSSSVFAF